MINESDNVNHEINRYALLLKEDNVSTEKRKEYAQKIIDLNVEYCRLFGNLLK